MIIAAITENFTAGPLPANAERVAKIIRTFMRQQSPTLNGGGAQTFRWRVPNGKSGGCDS